MLPAEAVRHRFTVEEFRKMGEAGIFGEDDRVELVEGEIVEMTPIGWRHAETVDRMNGLFNRWTVLRGEDDGLRVGVQNPLVLGKHGEHYPDLVLYRAEGVRGRVPEARDALIVVEVADASVSYDRNVKLPLYARAGVPEAWLVDLSAEGGVVEVHSEARETGYAALRRYGRTEKVRSATLAGLEFPAADILPEQ